MPEFQTEIKNGNFCINKNMCRQPVCFEKRTYMLNIVVNQWDNNITVLIVSKFSIDP